MTEGLSPKPWEVEGGPKRGRVGQSCPPSSSTGISTSRRDLAADLLQVQWPAIKDSSFSCSRRTDATPSRGSDCRSIADAVMLKRCRDWKRAAE